MPIDSNNKYTKMQKTAFEADALNWSPTFRDPVVGHFDAHNNWKDYDVFLFKNINTKNKIGLDFGCGPGRNIVKFADKFQRIDGVDISQNNLDKAKIWFNHSMLEMEPNLYMNNGVDLSCISGTEIYDIVFSTIAIQHICVYEIRFSLFSEFYRLLKHGGHICIQMGFGPKIKSSGYYENNYSAIAEDTCDVRIEDANYLKLDLEKIGFSEFNYDIRPVGPGDTHESWIFFRAKKL
jgi:ubiquinone/menaquinone biosynthesis C-methylase UbiE